MTWCPWKWFKRPPKKADEKPQNGPVAVVSDPPAPPATVPAPAPEGYAQAGEKGKED